jgi:hypothetical protein
MLSYELVKIALADGYFSRYLRSYVATSIILISFEILLNSFIQTKKGNTEFENIKKIDSN